MSETETIIAPDDDRLMQLLAHFDGRVEEVVVEKEMAGRVVRERIKLRVDPIASEVAK